jgi:hypothetical protein
MGEDEVMKIVRTGKSKRKAWKRMITKHTYVGEVSFFVGSYERVCFVAPRHPIRRKK